MKLNGVNILNLASLKQNFDLEQLWPAVKNGTLREFECVAAKGKFLSAEIVSALDAMNGGAPDFAQHGLDPEALRRRLLGLDGSFCAYTRNGGTGRDFFDRSWADVEALAGPLRESCTAGQAWTLYLGVLVQIQARPKDAFREQDTAFLNRLLSEGAKSAPSGADTAPSSRRLCACASMLLCSAADGVYAWLWGAAEWKALHREPVARYAYTESLGMIAVRPDGTLSAQTQPDIRELAKGREIADVTAFGDGYALLTRDGELLSNLRLPPSLRWGSLCAVHLGLNSLTGITDPLRGVVQIGSDERLTDFTGVRSVDTRTDGARRFAVLREGGELHLDFLDRPLTRVEAACLGRDGCCLVARRHVFFYGWDGAGRAVRTLPEEFRASEICTSNGRVACIGRCGGEDRIFVAGREEPLPALPAP